MAAGIQRFLSFELGRGNEENLKHVFRTALSIQLVLAGLIIVLSETVGLWFLNNKMTIPADRLVAANWVYQLSILSFVFIIFQSPFYAVIIAHEKWTFMHISILGYLKLLVVLLISMSPVDKLITYALLLSVVTFAILLIYVFYAKNKFQEID